jgi:hypothetical protein
MFDISTAFDSSSKSVSDFFQTPDVGFYIPLYQREYSWSRENIDQLMEDICNGVDLLVDPDKTDYNAIRFLGTIILLAEKDKKNNIYPLDDRGLPETIYNVIDGQQRISTLALLACQVYERLCFHESKLPKNPTDDGIRNACDSLKEAVNRYKSMLQKLFSVDLKRGNPQQKPIIIRGQVDTWTFEGTDDSYQSDTSYYLALFIRTISEENPKFPPIPKSSLVGANLRKMSNCLKKVVEDSHKSEDEDQDFPSASEILERVPQEDLWSYDRPELVEVIKNGGDKIPFPESRIWSIIQLLAFSYYLLKRCCFTIILPNSEDWAFDMFQSLNATGTPLTALETFKPLVVNSVSNNGGFQESLSADYFAEIDNLFSDCKSSSDKNKLTNDYLNLFGLTYNGGKEPSRQFSSQRRWLTDRYNECSSPNDKQEFIHRMADIATYWNDLVKYKDPAEAPIFEETQYQEQKKEAIFCLVYLQDANHKMANTVLSRFYSLYLKNKDDNDAVLNFMNVCKVVAAFFTLWRSALPNAGLDEIYRTLLRTNISWKKGDSELSLGSLKSYFQDILEDKKIRTQADWKQKAMSYLRYDNVKIVSKFALMVTSHNTIPDPEETGLMKSGEAGSSPDYLDSIQWKSPDVKTIEHIAPQKSDRLHDDDSWDEALYNQDDYQQIGNLTLLPTNINSSAANKKWIQKWIYYCHLGENNQQEIGKLQQKAQEHGVELKDSTITNLTKASLAHHIKPIVQVGPTGTWDKALVERRTERICDILWERMNQWLTE